jgi:RNA polymerase subunit RPABC4/transcription elongation factor Spt4
LDLTPIFDAIGEFFDNPIIQFALQAIAVYFVVLWLAAAYWAFRDLQLRTSNPIAPYLAAALIIVFTPVFFPLAVIVYKIVRPGERIGEVNERHLAEEALLAEVEAIRTCPTCHRRVHEEWIICPTCRTRLNRVCPNCGKLVGLDWSICAWCGRDFERRDQSRLASLPPMESPATIGPVEAPAVAARASVRGTSSGRSTRSAGGSGSAGASGSTRSASSRTSSAVPPDVLSEP